MTPTEHDVDFRQAAVDLLTGLGLYVLGSTGTGRGWPTPT
jgi:hypothetical protein